MRTILVVEDNQLNMKLAVLLLGSAGYRTLQANDAETGIALAGERHPDLILMDIQLPGMDGLSAIRTLKQDALTSAIKIVALSGRATGEDQLLAREAGCDAYVTKPIDLVSFLDTVASLLAGDQQ